MSTFEGLILLERPTAYWLLTLSSHVRKLATLRVQTTGIPVLRKKTDHVKPTTAAIQSFGHRATKNVVHLSRQQIIDVLNQGGIRICLTVSPGYVILAYQEHILGCGLYTGGRLTSQIPRAYLPSGMNTPLLD